MNYEVISLKQATTEERNLHDAVVAHARKLASKHWTSDLRNNAFVEDVRKFAQGYDTTNIRKDFLETMISLSDLSTRLNSHVSSDYARISGETEAVLFGYVQGWHY